IEHVERLGFDEAWVGEHHSGALEIIGSPELFIASAAERTRHIRLGTGVVSLPYHHPFMVAQRITQLDYQTHGRLMFGVGAGSLGSDAHMLGTEQKDTRERLGEALEAVIDLFNGKVVSKKTSWFELRDAQTQLPCLQRPHPELCIASSGSPSAPRMAGRFGAGLLSLGATNAAGLKAMASTWGIWSESAAAHGHTPLRTRWRISGPVHIAETREQALSDVRYGIRSWVSYLRQLTPLEIPGGDEVETDVDAALQAVRDSGLGVIGTPDDLILKIEDMWAASGGFGCWLDMAPTWADFPAKLRSYELIAHQVVPYFRGAQVRRRKSFDWAVANKASLLGARRAAIDIEVRKWEATRKAGA
ncbi:MAG: LLM class flavin-dependent oxidoreductase, partial [Acetobacteraceae bacterium]|nr:LLM class flavin-dependent oxidoreductase [Acetobacteraceae bacterium]